MSKPDIDDLLADFGIYDHDIKRPLGEMFNPLQELKAALYQRLANEAVEVVPIELSRLERFKAIPLSKLAELMGVNE